MRGPDRISQPHHHLFFHLVGHPKELPSFPTRRSSDLSCSGRGREACRRSLRPRLCRRSRWCGRCDSRSEEHTSELQSRRDLVCRLLLEKKKTELPPCCLPGKQFQTYDRSLSYMCSCTG